MSVQYFEIEDWQVFTVGGVFLSKAGLHVFDKVKANLFRDFHEYAEVVPNWLRLFGKQNLN